MRLELLHVMVVGFPISFLSVGVLLRLIAFVLRRNPIHSLLVNISRSLIGAGILFGIIAIFTGSVALDIVEDQLCDLNIIKYHKRCAFILLTLFSLGLLFDQARNIRSYLVYISSTLFWIAPIFLFLTGYYGGALVFEQGAAVKKICLGPEEIPPSPTSPNPFLQPIKKILSK